MIVEIKGTGQKAQFPDGMSQEEMLQALRRQWPSASRTNTLNMTTQGSVEPVEQTLEERIKQGVADFLFNQGIISDRYGAQRIGENIAMGAGALPVIGDMLGGDELGRALREGDATGIGFGALAALPVVGDAVKSFRKLSATKILDDFEIDDVDAFENYYRSIDYKIPNEMLHGTSGDHKSLSSSYAGDVSSGAGDGIWLTDSRKYAWEYAQNASSKRGSSPKIMRFSPKDVTSPLVVEFSPSGTPVINGVKMPEIEDNESVLKIAKKVGADSVWFPSGSFTDEPSLVIFDGNKADFIDEEVFD